MSQVGASHQNELEISSAISPTVIACRGYQTITNPRALPDAFASYQRKMHGLLIPIRDVTGEIASYQLKPDNPRTNASGKIVKYETAANGRMCLDVPQSVLPTLRDTAQPLWLTEGSKKVDSALSNGIPVTVGLLGVDGWGSQGVALPDWREVALRGRDVIISFDSDVMTSDRVRGALERLAAWLRMQKANVSFLLMPSLPNGDKRGLDDHFANGGTCLELDDLIVETLPGSVMDWQPPIPLDPMTGPPFPLDALPGVIGEYVAAVAEETQTPLDMAGSVGFGTLSAACGGKYEVVIPEHGWHEPVHVMSVTVAEPGTRKSGVIRLMTKPIADYERDVQPDERRAFAQWESRLRVLEKQLAAAENDASKKRASHADHE